MGDSAEKESMAGAVTFLRLLKRPVHHIGCMTVAVFFIVAAPAIVYTLNHFYVDGAATDSWWHAWIVWRNSLNLDMPASIAGGPSFYSVHLSPFLAIPALVSHFLPVGMFNWYSLFIGAGYGLLGVAVFTVLLESIYKVDRLSVLLIFPITIAYGFGGFGLAALQLPHYEIFFVGFAVLFLAALARDDRRASWIWLVFALLIREDAGLHLFCVLVVTQLLCRKREAWPFLYVSLGYAVLAFVVKHAFWPPWPAGGSLIVHNFTGNPPYAHLSFDLVIERLSTVFWWRGYIWQTALVCVLWAIWARDKLIVAGLVSVLPWMILCLTGVAGAVTTFDQYYAFPLLLAMIWPAVAVRWRHGESASRLRLQTLAWMFAMALAGAIGWRGGFVCYPCSDTLRAGDARVQPVLVEEFGARLREALPELGRTRVDMGVRALWPDAGERVGWLNPEDRTGYTLRGNDTVIWFNRSLQDSPGWAAALASRLTNHYRVVGSNIVIATNRKLEDSTFSPQVRRANLLWERMQPMPIAQRTGEGIAVSRNAPDGLIAYGPHSWRSYGINSHHSFELPAGRYEARFLVRAAGVGNVSAPVVRLEVAIHGGPTLAARDWRVGAAYNASGQEILDGIVGFEIPPSHANRILLLRAIHLGNAQLTLRDIALARTD